MFGGRDMSPNPFLVWSELVKVQTMSNNVRWAEEFLTQGYQIGWILQAKKFKKHKSKDPEVVRLCISSKVFLNSSKQLLYGKGIWAS